MNEIVFVIEPDRGRLTVESSKASSAIAFEISRDLGQGSAVNCGRPYRGIAANAASEISPDVKTAYIYRIYHDSVADGPGRRSVVQFAGCSLRCPGCYVPETHDRENGRLMRIKDVVAEIEAVRTRHDGVTILGGEPFDQPGALLDLVTALKSGGFHIVVYTGNTLENLCAQNSPLIDEILTKTDILIDGPFIASQSKNAGEYRGSANQRIFHNPFG